MDIYEKWKSEAHGTFDCFVKNDEFDLILDYLKEVNITLGTNATYYYYDEEMNKADTRRYLYYEGYAVFKLILTVDKSKNIRDYSTATFELIGKPEKNREKIQDIKLITTSENFQNIYNQKTYDLKNEREFSNLKDSFKSLLLDLDKYIKDISFKKCDKELELKSIKISNFKNIENVQINFENKLQLIVGSNNAGKTSLIQGIILSYRALHTLFEKNKIYFENGSAQKNIVKENKGITVTKIPFTVENPMELFHIDSIGQHNAGVELAKFTFQNDYYITLSMSLVGGTFSIKINDYSEGLSESKLSSFLEKNATLVPSFFNVTVFEERKTKGRYLSLMKTGNYNLLFRNILYDLKNIEYSDDVLEENIESEINRKSVNKFNILKEHLDDIFGVKELDVTFNEDFDEFITAQYKINDKAFDISTLGMGTLQFIQVVAQCFTGEPVLILLDEPDAHLNSKLQKEVIKFFNDLANKYNINFLMATHSKDMINSVSPNQVMYLLDGKLNKVDENEKLLNIFNEIGTTTEELIGLRIGKRVVMVEGIDDIEYINELCKLKDLHNLDYFRKINFIDFNGRRGVLNNDLKNLVNDEWNEIKKIAVFDKDYRFDDSQNKEIEKLNEKGFMTIGWKKKELENYLLIDDLIIRTLNQDYNTLINAEDIKEVIDETYKDFKIDIEMEFEKQLKNEKQSIMKLENSIKFESVIFTKQDESEIRSSVCNYIELNGKRNILSGKVILERIRKKYIKTTTPKQKDFVIKLISRLEDDEIHEDVKQLLQYIKEMAICD